MSAPNSPADDRPPRLNPTSAELPDHDQLLVLTRADSPHPAVLEIDELLARCEFRTQSRSGPGGQHRNRTASGVFVTYRPAEVTAEATEQRNQHRNREVAIRRLRFILAVSLRTHSPLTRAADVLSDTSEQAVRDRYRGTPLKLAEDNVMKPAVLALLLNDLYVAGGQPSLVAPLWNASTSRVVSFLRTYPAAWTLVNRIRAHHHRKPLR